MDLILRNAHVFGLDSQSVFDIAIKNGHIVAIEPRLAGNGREINLQGRLIAPGFIETHIHLDKSNILERCKSEKGNLEEAIEQVAAAKKAFTPEDVHDRAARTLEKCILQGTTHMRTQVELDPVIGLRGLEGVVPLAHEYKWAIDLEICVYPQEGLLNNPGTDELLVEALKRGVKAVGAAPYTDTNPHGQIDRVFEMAREFDVDIDMHLDFGNTPENLDVEYVCDQTEKFGYGGRVTIGHVTKMSCLPMDRFQSIGRRLADVGVAVTVMPSTDLFLMGRERDHNVIRGLTPAHRLLRFGVNCNLCTNNVLNPFTPFGDCSMIRMANLYANICHVGKRDEIRECFEMVTRRAAKVLRLTDYGIEVGKSADLVVLDCAEPETAVAELAAPLYGFKRGRLTFTRKPVDLQRP